MVKIKSISKRSLIIIGLAVLILGVGILYGISRKSNLSTSSNTNHSEQDEVINLDPPTEEDIRQVEDNKQRIIEGNTSNEIPVDPITKKQQVSPQISYASLYNGALEVGGYVQGIFESDGACTAVAAKAGSNTRLTKTVSAIPNASSTDCPVMVFSREELSDGEWDISIEYSSNHSAGTSNTTKVIVK